MNQGIERALPRQRGTAPEQLLPSRAAALDCLRAALLSQDGPVLVTGEAGVGKTWLSRQLQTQLPYPWRWAHVDVTPATDPAGFLRDIARAVGLAEPSRAAARWAFVDALTESAAEGERWALVVEEAHNASEAVWEEIRVLGNHLGAAGGFAGIVLLAQTPLTRRLRTRVLAPLAARLGLQVHLAPLDIEESRHLLELAAPGWSASARSGDELHRDAAGNPRRLVQLAMRLPRPPALATDVKPLRPEPVSASPSVRTPDIEAKPVHPTPSLVPAKPPLHDEDGMIEVGWDPVGVELGDETPGTATQAEPAVLVHAVPSEESIDDHYAALQAWSEWAKNQGRATTASAVEPRRIAAPDVDPADDTAADRVAAAGHASVWAEGQHGFAPYSQLFSRLRQPRDTL